MSDNKKYYYLKLKENFFESDEMILLESMPDGYMYSNILLKMYLRSLKDGGRLMVSGRIPYNADMLAMVLRHPVGVMEKALNVFRELGLIDVMDNGAIYMMDIQNFIGKSSSEGDRKRIYRQRIELEGQMSGQTSTRDRDRDRDRDIAQSCEPTLSPEPPVFVFPCIKNQTYPVTQRQIDEWAEAYPRVDINLAIKQMIAWLNSNPSKRKTVKGCPRFINAWLGKDQDSGRNERKETKNATGSASIWDKFTV